MANKHLTKQDLIERLEYLTEDQLDFVRQLIEIFSGFRTRKDLRDLAGLTQIDTAMPQQEVDHMQDNYPWWKMQNYVYDYTEKDFGEMKNIYEALIEKAFKVFENE